MRKAVRNCIPFTQDEVRLLSDDVLAVAQAALKAPISNEAWQRLLDAGLALRKLAGLPPPWEETERSAAMAVIQSENGWIVADDTGKRAGPFTTNAQAWSWIDRHSDEGLDDSERYSRIRMAFNGSLVPDRH